MCDRVDVLGATDPECAVDRAECDAQCPSLDEELRACIAAASSCDDLIACAGASTCSCDVDVTCSPGCACDVHCGSTTDPDAGGGGGGGCTDTCTYAGDGACDDGGPGSEFSICELGTDCTDCGPR